MTSPRSKQRTANLSAVRADECYPLALFSRAVGLGREALAQARREGLVVRYRHGRAYVIGADWLRYLTGDTTASSPACVWRTDADSL